MPGRFLGFFSLIGSAVLRQQALKRILNGIRKEMMKKLVMLVLAILLSVMLCACINGERRNLGKADTSGTFQVGSYPIVVTAPSGWEEAESGNLDLQCIGPKGDMYLSAYGFSALDIPEGKNAQAIFELQNEDLFSRRDYVKVIESVTIKEEENKITYSMLYSAELEGNKNYYYTFLVQFKETGDMAWILFTGMPSVIEKNKEMIEEIAASAENRETY